MTSPMKIVRHASVAWAGGSKTGEGAITTQSKALNSHPYGYGSRFAEQNGTNPEELIAAAHAGCFTMFLAFILDGAKLVADQLTTKAALTLEISAPGSFEITAIELTLTAKIRAIDQATFESLVAQAKAGCAVSKLINAKISLNATLLPSLDIPASPGPVTTLTPTP
jgi:osmotically inducible protein OsmC